MPTQTDPISAAHAYRTALRRILNVQTLHEARKIASQAIEITFHPPEPGILHTSSGFGHNTRQPFVEIGLANPTESANPMIQVSAAQARQFALQILEAADAAESDGFVLTWLSETAELSEGQGAQVLQEFRAYREKLRGEG